jgi:hemerythrin-like metal-binding protein
MKFVEWTASLSVQSDVLDGHHKMIVDCLNQLHPLLGVTGREQEVHDVVEQLENFVLIHFSEEEQCMKKAGYPDWPAHKLLHDKMYDVVYDLKADIEHNRTVDANRLFELMYNWLLSHIMVEDKKYVSYLLNPVEGAGARWHRYGGHES